MFEWWLWEFSRGGQCLGGTLEKLIQRLGEGFADGSGLEYTEDSWGLWSY